MSEMLANHYFLIRDYNSAISIYERIIKKDFSNKSVKKKLTICYISVGEVDKALNLFLAQIKEDIDFIINTDIQADDCPCPEIISEIENQERLFKNENEKTTALGMLWLYCHLEKSSEFFKKAEVKNPDDHRIAEIKTILIKKLLLYKQNSLN